MKAENISSTTSQVVSQENEQNESKSDGKRKFKTDLKDFYHPHLKFVSLHTGFQHVVVWVELLEEINKKKKPISYAFQGEVNIVQPIES